ncbi:MAG: hypothetical protein KA586_04410 [Candidatus Promineofilum sp.]|nr:hypothetical protein [Promineifilum sp.]
MLPTDNTYRLNLLFLGLTAIFVGYFVVWLPGPGAGLQLIGIEIGEWIKFLGVGAGRNWFYLPPIVIGTVVALLAAMWPNSRIQTWLARGLAIAAALLSFPAVAAIQLEPLSEWLARLLGIGWVIGIAGLGAIISRRSGDTRRLWMIVAIVALTGAFLPTIQYLAVRPLVEAALNRSLGIGAGVWLNAGGSVLVLVVALIEFRAASQTKRTAAA